MGNKIPYPSLPRIFIGYKNIIIHMYIVYLMQYCEILTCSLYIKSLPVLNCWLLIRMLVVT